jgi:hypothetical protein
MSETGNPIRRKLAAARQWWRTTGALSGLGWTIVAVVVLSLVCYHADSRLTLSAHAREVWRVGIAAVGCLLLLTAVLRALLRPLPDAVMAAHVEQKYPALHERLLTAVDLSPSLAIAGGDPSTGFSRSMTVALLEETQQASAPLNFRRAVNLAPLRRAGLAALAVLLLLGGEAGLAPDAFANWVRRMRDPRADIAPWANTRVYVKPEAELLPRGAGVGVVVVTRGLVADRSVLHYRPAGDKNAPWKTVDLNGAVAVQADATTPQPTLTADHAPMAKEEIRRFRYRIPTLPQSVEMYATANDGRSNERGVTVEDRPAFSNFKMTFHYPAYTHKATQTLTVSSGDIAALAGTEVDVVGIANKPLKTVDFSLNRSEPTAWPVSGEQTQGHLSVRKDAFYGLALKDRHGFASDKAAPYAIKAQADQAPTVQISRPATDMDLVPNGSLPLVAHAGDDYGIAGMKLVYDAQKGEGFGGSAMKTVSRGSLALPGPNGSPNADVNERWHIGSIQAKVGETIRYAVDAIDNCAVGGPHTAHSNSYRIHVVSVVEMQQHLKEALDEEAHALAELRTGQIEAQKQLEAARQKQDKSAMARAQEAERAVGEQAKSLTSRVESLSAQLENNNFATKSELERRNEAKQTLQNLAALKIPAAADAVKKAQDAKKGEAAAPLAQAGKQESEVKHAIEQAQAKLSRTPPADQLAAEAARLAKEQQDRADTARTLAEDIKAQQQKNGNNTVAPEDKIGLETEKKNQAEINADTQKLQSQLEQAAKAAAERGDPKQAKALKQAADALKQGQAEQHQQQASQSLKQNDPSKAAPQQDRAATALEKAAAAAKQAAETQNGQQATAEQLHQTAKQLAALAQAQKELADKAGENPGPQESQKLAQKQQELQKQAQDAQKGLNGAAKAQQSLQKAQQSQQQAGQKLSQNSPQSAQSPAQQAAQQLQQAAQQAEQAAQQIDQAQAAAEMADRVEHLAQVQKALKDTTARLEAAKQRGPLDSNAKGELGQVAQRQKNIEQEANNLAEKLPSPAFKQALTMAARQAHPATQALNPNRGLGDTGPPTQAAQARAAQTLETIAAALKQQAQGAQNQQQQQQQQDGQQQQQAQSAQQAQEAAALGNLLLAKGLQQGIRQNTGELEQARTKNSNQQLTPAQQQDVKQLAQDQKATQEITQQAAQDLADLPEALKTVQQATQHQEQAGNKLQQQQTGQPTQGHQDEALKGLDQATKQVQQAMQKQQEQQKAQQQAQQGAPKPNGQQGKDGDSKKAFTKLEGVQNGQTSNVTGRSGKFGSLDPRTQRTLHEGQGEKVSAEYQEAVKRYFSALGDKKR